MVVDADLYRNFVRWSLLKSRVILKFIVLFLGNITEEMVHLLPCEHRKDSRQAAENLPGVLYRERATLKGAVVPILS